jgi:hypothetical protein
VRTHLGVLDCNVPTREDELSELLLLDEDQLYIALARSDPANADVMFSPVEARETGRRTFDRLQEPLRQRICDEWNYCAKRKSSDFGDTLTLAAAVADVIVTVLGGIPAGTVATLLVKKGLSSLCGCRSNDDD